MSSTKYIPLPTRVKMLSKEALIEELEKANDPYWKSLQKPKGDRRYKELDPRQTALAGLRLACKLHRLGKLDSYISSYVKMGDIWAAFTWRDHPYGPTFWRAVATCINKAAVAKHADDIDKAGLEGNEPIQQNES